MLLLSYGMAASLDDVTINSTGLNTVININNEINLSSLTVGSNGIYFGGLNSSNPSQNIQAGESISFNITEANASYTEVDLPYFSVSSGMVKKIYSDLDSDVSGSITFSVATCTVYSVVMDTFGTANDKTYTSSEWSCSNKLLTVNYTGLHSGNTYFYAFANIVASACSIGNENATLYFSIYDEDDPDTLLEATAEVELNYWVYDTSQFIQNFTVEFSGNHTYALCLNNNETSLNTDLYIKYTTANGFTHRYILANNTLEVGSPQNYSIYNFNTSTDISDLKITIRQNSNYNYYPNVIAKLQRRYTAEGVWRTVQMDKSGDFGLVFFNIREENTDYRLIFTDMSNNVLKTTNTIKLVCTSGICELTVLLDPFSGAASSSDLITSYVYDNATRLITFNWEDPSAGSNTVRIRARQETATGPLSICDQTQTGAAGSMTCDLSGRQGVVAFTVFKNGDILTNNLIDVASAKLGTLVGDKEGGFWAVGLMVICVMFGLFSPVGSVIAMLISLIVIYLLGIFTPITITFIIIAAAIGIVIGIKVRN